MSQKPDGTPLTRSLPAAMYWIPFALIATVVAFSGLLDQHIVHPWPPMLSLLTLLFLVLIPLFAAFFAFRGYLGGGPRSVLLLGCAWLALGLGFLFDPIYHLVPLGELAFDRNMVVTFLNLGALFHGLLAFAGLICSQSCAAVDPIRRHSYIWAWAAFVVVVLCSGGAAALVWSGNFPIFLRGDGDFTLARQIVVWFAVAASAAAALVSHLVGMRAEGRFFHWFALSLWLFAVGFLALLAPVPLGTPLTWAGRFCLFTSGAYLLGAILVLNRDYLPVGLSLDGALAHTFRQLQTDYRPLVDSAGESILALDRHRRIVYCNTAGQKEFGLSLSEMYGRDLLEFAAAPNEFQAQLDGLPRDDQGFLSGGAIEAGMMDAEGREFPAELTLLRKLTPRGKMTLVVLRDITTRVRSENALRSARSELEQRVRARTEDLADANEALRNDVEARRAVEQALVESEERLRRAESFSLTMVGLVHPDGRWKRVPDQLCELTGHSQEDLESQSVAAATHEDDWPLEEEEYRRLREGDIQSFELEKRFVRKDGEPLWVYMSATAVDGENRTPEHFLVHMRDITEPKRVEQERERLRAQSDEQRNLLEQLVQHASIAIAVISRRDMRYLVANPYYASILAQPGGHMKGRSVDEVGWVLGGRSRLDAVIESGEAQHHVESEQPAPNEVAGSLWNIDYIPILDADGNVEMVLILAHDVTEEVAARKEVERLARQAEQSVAQLEAVFGSIHEGLVVVGLDGQIVAANPAFKEMHAVGRGRSAPPNVYEFDARFELYDENGDYVSPQQWPISRALSGEDFSQCEYTVKRRDVEWSRIWSYSGSPVRDKKGDMLYALLTIRDVTQRRRDEEELIRQRRAFQRLAENVPAIIFRLDKEERYTFISPSVEEACGIPPGDFIGRTSKEAGLPPHLCEIVSQSWEKVLQRQIRERVEFAYPADSGDRHYVAVFVPERDASGELESVLGLAHDITERKQAEERYRTLSEVLEQRVAERTGEAHRRAGQLRAMALSLSQAEQRERRRLAQVLHDHLQQLLVAAKMQLGMTRRVMKDEALVETLQQIEDVIDESVRASKSLTVELSPPVLYDAGLGPAFEWLANHMQEKHGLHVNLDMDRDELPEMTEEINVVIFRAVQELLFNVVKHANVEEADLKVAAPDEFFSVVVSDKGRGFDPVGTNEQAPGYGLFSIRERLVQLGGELLIDSAPDDGTRVELQYPLALAAGAKEAALPDAATQAVRSKRLHAEQLELRVAEQGPARVIVADDHQIVRDGLVSLLELEPDIEVVGAAEDGLAAVQMAETLKPDIVVMDINMPKMGGIDATRRIRAQLPDVRVIGLSMLEQAEMASSMLQAGAVAYLRKGGSTEELVEAIRSACGLSGQ